MLWKSVFNYLDDLFVFSRSFPEHLLHLKQALETLRESGLTLSPSKCSFAAGTAKCLGYIITRNGYKPDPSKVEVIKTMKPPTNKTELRSFLGSLNYWRRFIPSLAMRANKLFPLLKNGAPFDFTDECKAQFNDLRTCLVTPPYPF